MKKPTLEEIKEKYHLCWMDWYYWPLEDEDGCKKALERLEAVGKELNSFPKDKK